MHIAILTFDGFNELDSLIAYGILARARPADWRISIASPEAQPVSWSGLRIEAQCGLDEAIAADAVLIGSGARTRELVQDPGLMARLQGLDPKRQLLAAQCSGALILARLGLLHDVPACTDLTTKPWVQEAGVEVLNQPFFARGNIATAGGCLASSYLAAWLIARLHSLEAARAAIHYVAPVGEKDEVVARTLALLQAHLPPDAPSGQAVPGQPGAAV